MHQQKRDRYAKSFKALRKDPSLQALLQLPGKVGDEQRAAFEKVFQGMDADDDRSISCVEFTEFIAKQMGLRAPARPGSAAGEKEVAAAASPRERR